MLVKRVTGRQIPPMSSQYKPSTFFKGQDIHFNVWEIVGNCATSTCRISLLWQRLLNIHFVNLGYSGFFVLWPCTQPFMAFYEWVAHHLFTSDCGYIITLWWRHNDHDSVSNHQPHECLLNRLFRRRSKKTSKLRVTGLCVGNSPGPVNSPHKGPVTRKMFPFDDVIMT